MTVDDVDIGTATEADLDGILELQAANQPKRGGMLTANLSSLSAHAKMGMREVASFGFEGQEFVAFSYGG